MVHEGCQKVAVDLQDGDFSVRLLLMKKVEYKKLRRLAFVKMF